MFGFGRKIDESIEKSIKVLKNVEYNTNFSTEFREACKIAVAAMVVVERYRGMGDQVEAELKAEQERK